MSMWDGIEAVTVNQKLPFLTKGSYLVELVEAMEGKGGLTKEPFFKVSFKVVEATGENATPVSTVACMVYKQDKYGYFLRDIKALTAAICAINPNDVTADLVEGLTKTTEAVGTRFQIQVSEEPKKNGLGTIHKHRYFAASVSSGEAVPF